MIASLAFPLKAIYQQPEIRPTVTTRLRYKKQAGTFLSWPVTDAVLLPGSATVAGDLLRKAASHGCGCIWPSPCGACPCLPGPRQRTKFPPMRKSPFCAAEVKNNTSAGCMLAFSHLLEVDQGKPKAYKVGFERLGFCLHQVEPVASAAPGPGRDALHGSGSRLPEAAAHPRELEGHLRSLVGKCEPGAGTN